MPSVLKSSQVQTMEKLNGARKIPNGVAPGAPQVFKVKITVPTTSVDTIGDKIHLLALPWNLSVHRLELLSTNLDTDNALRLDLGLSYGVDVRSVAPGTQLSLDCYADNFAAGPISAAGVARLDLAFKKRALTALNQTVWADGGLTKAPEGQGNAYLTLTVKTAGTTPVEGTIVAIVEGTLITEN
jgi:hypothetical protein